MLVPTSKWVLLNQLLPLIEISYYLRTKLIWKDLIYKPTNFGNVYKLVNELNKIFSD